VADDSEPGLQLSRVGDVIVFSAPSLRLPARLSRAEQAIAQAVVAGRSNAEIAAARATSSKTVANQLYAIYRKLGVETREQLVAQLVSESGPEAAAVSADDRRRS
jgi:DNA-binding CsgD family transcriptional regulator